MKNLKVLTEAIKNGCNIHAFRSGGGLRVVRIEKDNELKGYGEHPYISEALEHVAENYSNPILYEKQYSGEEAKYTHYLTGAHPTGIDTLDLWIYNGYTFDAFLKDAQIVVELVGYNKDVTPIKKIAIGDSFEEAMEKALVAEEIKIKN